MATESLMRLVESGGSAKWPSFKDAARLGSSLKDSVEKDPGLLLEGHRFHEDQANIIPSRSGSAPPSMEGSFAALGNLLAQQNLSMSSSLESLSSMIEHCESEEQLRSDPAYLAYYCSNVNLNPRLPPPLMSRENRRLVRHMGGLGMNWRSASSDDNGDKSSYFARGSLSTHKEEPEDERSPPEAVMDFNDTSSELMSEQNTTSLGGLHKSLVDLMQDDSPRTPSPVYSQSQSSSHAAEESFAHDVNLLSEKVSSIRISNASESKPGPSDVGVAPYNLEMHSGGTKIKEKDESLTKYSGLRFDQSNRNTIQSGMDLMEPKMRIKHEEQQSRSNYYPQQYLSAQGVPHEVHGLQIPSISQGLRQSHGGVENLSHNNLKFPSVEVRPPMHSAALNPLYASPGAYTTAGAQFYPNFQAPGLYSPQYGVGGGYPLSSPFLPQFMTTYPSHSAVPMPFATASAPTYDGRSVVATSGETISHGGGMQHPGKFYGQHGIMVSPSAVDPLHMQYFQQPFGDAYASATVNHHMVDQKLQPPINAGLGIPRPGAGGISSSNYYGSPQSPFTQFLASPMGSPVLPSSPVGSLNLGRRNDVRFSQGSSRNIGPYSGDPGQRGISRFDDPKRHYFLEELKSSNGRKFELTDIAGHIVEFSVDQHGSRFIQQKLEHCSIDEKISVFKEVLPHASKLMTDVFGNYVIQKFFEHGSPEQRKELADKLTGQMTHLSLQMYGCRVIQKALEVIELDQKSRLVRELDGHVMKCVHDQNGNHVIQKCIECVLAVDIEFIISAFRGQVASLSTHPYGCRVIQRVLEHCSEEPQSRFIIDEILESAYVLAQDQYGNYVTQHVLEKGRPYERSEIIGKLTGKIVPLSRHKYASNVVEKCLEYGDAAERESLIEEIIGQSEENDSLLTMMKDQFANYVVQKILDISTGKQREELLRRIKVHLNALVKYTYGKHIVARVEQMCGEEDEALES